MAATSGEQMRPFYNEARATYPALPADFILYDDHRPEDGEAFTHGVNQAGLPIFSVASGYVLPRATGLHESGHAYQAVATYWGIDALRRYWDFRNFGMTLEQAWAESERATSGNQRWQLSPQESFAEAFRVSFMGGTEKAMNWGKDLAPEQHRAFFLSLFQKPNEEVLAVETWQDKAAVQINRWVTPAYPSLPVPTCFTRPGEITQFRYEWNRGLWRPEFGCPDAPPHDLPLGLWVHEQGHHFEDHCYRWGPYRAGGVMGIRRAFLQWHGADMALMDFHDLDELVAEHFTTALLRDSTGYDYNTYWAYKGKVPFTSTAHTRAFFDSIYEEAYAMAKFISPDLAVATDASGNGRLIVGVEGLRPNFPAVGFAQRIGLVGTEPVLPNASFSVAADSSFGVLNFRGDPVKSGTSYWRVAAIQ